MKIETKFDLNQKVYAISQRSKTEFILCSTCGGTGSITIKETDENLTCPKCYGRGGSNEHKALEWMVCSESFVGKINVEIYDDRYRYDHENRYSYMLDSTGVGSGAIWYEEKLFATEEEATAECKKRNENPES